MSMYINLLHRLKLEDLEQNIEFCSPHCMPDKYVGNILYSCNVFKDRYFVLYLFTLCTHHFLPQHEKNVG